MPGGLRRTHWAVALAAWVGGLVGSFVAASMDSLGISTEGAQPLLGGSAAIYVAFVLGGMAGAATGAWVAFAAGRDGHEPRGALLGGAAAVGVAAVAGYFSEKVAEWWATTFFQEPLSAALAGGLIAGAAAGVASTALRRTVRPEGPPGSGERRFATLAGSLAGLLAGFGGGTLGSYLAQALCPGSTIGGPGPAVLSGCDFTQAAPLLGAWAGAAAGAVTGLAAGILLPRMTARAPAETPPP